MITDHNKISKFLSLILRHQPETIGLTLDENGWADITFIIEEMQNKNFVINVDILKAIVTSSDKQRFKLSDDGTKIRANQGHSIKVDLELVQKNPPEILFHGTATRNIASIKQQGLLKQNRHHVHLSGNTDTAMKVGMRYGKPIVLKIAAGKMKENGSIFYESENGVWLTDYVAPQYIIFEE